MSPEIQSMIQYHLAHGCSPSPEAVIKKALYALQAQETNDVPPKDMNMPTNTIHPEPDITAAQASPLLKWLRDTSTPAPELETLRRRLASIPGSLLDTLDEEREDRL